MKTLQSPVLTKPLAVRSSRTMALNPAVGIVQPHTVNTVADGATSLVVVDARLPQLDILLAELGSAHAVVRIEPYQDAVSVIGDALAQTQARSLAIVAHGVPGQVLIGRHGLSAASLMGRGHELQDWGVETISLYSCQTGADADFIQQLQDLSGANVFASAEVVGHRELGGLWQLTNAAGKVTTVPFSAQAQQQWQFTLIPLEVTASSAAELPPLTGEFDSYAVIIPEGTTSIGTNAFLNTPVTSVTIPDSVTTIGTNAFFRTPLTSVTLGNSVTTIGLNAFRDTKLTSVSIPDSVTTIGDSAFFGTALTSVSIPDSVTTIGGSTFGNTPLASVTLGNSVTTIGNSAFSGTALTSITIPDSVTTVGINAFLNTPLTSVTLGNSVTTIGISAFKETQLTSVSIPDSVTTIGRNAFSRTPLTSVTLGNSVTTIEAGAFAFTQLTSVIIPDSVTSIGINAFFDTSLTTVTLLGDSPLGPDDFPEGVNIAPKVETEIVDQGLQPNNGFTLNIRDNFDDLNDDDTLNFSATGLPSGITLDANTGVFSGSTTTPGTFDVTVTATDDDSEQVSDTFVLTVECFLTGTLISTEEGERAVETLKIGDLVQTADGTLEPIKWIGRQTREPNQVHNPLRSYPIWVKAGALGNGLPHRDLYVSPDHALLFEGLLINAGALVNGTSILKTAPTETFTYYHIELDKHALLVAEGTAAESYLPQKEDRLGYDNGAEYEERYPNDSKIILWPLDYPRISSYTTVPRYVRKKLNAIAAELGLVAKAS